MKVTQAMLVMMLFLGGCGGCGSCEHPGTAPTGSGAPAPAVPDVSPRAAAASPDTIHAGGAPATVASQNPTARPPIQAGGAPPAAQPPEAAAPEPADNDEDDCIVVADANPDYGPPPLAVAFSAEAECSGGEP